MGRLFDIMTFGETMIRLSPPNHERLEQASTLVMTAGGSEMNVAVAAQRLGARTSFVTRLTSNPLGRMIANKAREHGVDLSHVIWADSDRIGLYFVEFGASPRPSSVIYDRCGSAMAGIRAGEVDWKTVLKDVTLLHTSGITPALSAKAADATLEAVRAAGACGTQVSIDVNYRARLWTTDQARPVMHELAEMADILITTEEDTKRVFGIKGDGFEDVAVKLQKMFDLEAVVITLRETPRVWANTWSAMLCVAGQVHRAPTYEIEVVDRVGAGDCFAGGFLYGYLHGGALTGLDYGTAASALKQTHPGDLSWSTKQEVDEAIRGLGLRIVR